MVKIIITCNKCGKDFPFESEKGSGYLFKMVENTYKSAGMPRVFILKCPYCGTGNKIIISQSTET